MLWPAGSVCVLRTLLHPTSSPHLLCTLPSPLPFTHSPLPFTHSPLPFTHSPYAHSSLLLPLPLLCALPSPYAHFPLPLCAVPSLLPFTHSPLPLLCALPSPYAHSSFPLPLPLLCALPPSPHSPRQAGVLALKCPHRGRGHGEALRGLPLLRTSN